MQATLLLVLASTLCASAFPVVSDSGVREVPWKGTDRPDAPVLTDTVDGERGLLIRETVKQAKIFGEIAPDGHVWQSWYFQVDTVSYGDRVQAVEKPSVRRRLFETEVTEKIRYNYPDPFFVVQIGIDGKKTELNVLLVPGDDQAKWVRQRVAVIPGQWHCVETEFRLDRPDSILVSLYFDGRPEVQFGSQYFLPKDLFRFSFSNLPPMTVPVRIKVRDFGLSGKRLFSSPASPRNCTHVFPEPFMVILQCDPFGTNYQNESLKGVRWQVVPENASGRPVYDIIERDADFFSAKRVPFALEAGRYHWRARYLNNFDNWSGWSRIDTFTIDSQRQWFFRIDRAYLSDIGRDKAKDTVSPGRWYHLIIQGRPSGRWQDMGFLAVWMSHRGYTFGNPDNKGGEYLPGENYAFNLSFNWAGKPSRIYEKNRAGHYSSKGLDTGMDGLYISNRPEDILTDTVQGVFRFKVRIMETARPGPWYLSSYMAGGRDHYQKTGREALSNVYSASFNVAHAQARNGAGLPGWVRAALIALIALMGFFVLRRLKKKGPMDSAMESDYRRIRDYLEKRVSENDISVSGLMADLKLSKNRYYSIVQSAGFGSLSKLLNDVRVDKAKVLLEQGEKNVSEIGFELGFATSNYFSKVFKDATGFAPVDYRKKKRQV